MVRLRGYACLQKVPVRWLTSSSAIQREWKDLKNGLSTFSSAQDTNWFQVINTVQPTFCHYNNIITSHSHTYYNGIGSMWSQSFKCVISCYVTFPPWQYEPNSWSQSFKCVISCYVTFPPLAIYAPTAGPSPSNAVISCDVTFPPLAICAPTAGPSPSSVLYVTFPHNCVFLC